MFKGSKCVFCFLNWDKLDKSESSMLVVHLDRKSNAFELPKLLKEITNVLLCCLEWNIPYNDFRIFRDIMINLMLTVLCRLFWLRIRHLQAMIIDQNMLHLLKHFLCRLYRFELCKPIPKRVTIFANDLHRGYIRHPWLFENLSQIHLIRDKIEILNEYHLWLILQFLLLLLIPFLIGNFILCFLGKESDWRSFQVEWLIL